MLAADNFTIRLAQADLATKNDIVNFVKKADFDNKQMLKNDEKLIKNIIKEVFSNKTRHIEVKKTRWSSKKS